MSDIDELYKAWGALNPKSCGYKLLVDFYQLLPRELRFQLFGTQFITVIGKFNRISQFKALEIISKVIHDFNPLEYSIDEYPHD